MGKLHRNERIGALIKILSDNPNRIFTLNYFTDMFNAAKSTISEDIVIAKKLMEDFSFGAICTNYIINNFHSHTWKTICTS